MQVLKVISYFYKEASKLPLFYSLTWVITQLLLLVVTIILGFVYLPQFEEIHIKIIVGLTLALAFVAGSLIGTLKVHEVFSREENGSRS